MNSVTTVTLQPRGQITLPLKYRDYLGLEPGEVLKTSLKGRGVFVEPLAVPSDSNIIEPILSREEYLKVLRGISVHIKKHGPLWTKADDRRRAESLRKEKEKWKKLNW